MEEKESKTGTYRVIDGQLVKISDRVPRIASAVDGVYFRKPYYETFNGREAVWIESKGQKKAEMQARGLAEYNDFFKSPEPTEKVGTLYSYQNQPARKPQKQGKPIPENIKAILEKKAKLNNY